MEVVFCFLFMLCSIILPILETNAQGTYKAAVVEFAPKDETPQSINRIIKNVESYEYYMEVAAEKNAQIIVFPEDGLTGWDSIDNNTVHEFSTEVPDPTLNISPCRTPLPTFSEYFVHLSCAASTHDIYTVVNLIERRYDNIIKQWIYYNTDVVFNKIGIVIARYRKTNLFNEPMFVPGNEIVTFKTSFGVTFGIFICFDLLFKNPALDVLTNSSITDVVYSTAWFSHLPFYGSVSIQHGYAKSNGVNLLAAGMNNPLKKNGGSGIYLYDGRIAQMYISGVKGSKILIADVPKVLPDTPRDTCQIQNEAMERGIAIPGLPGGQLPDITNFFTGQQNLVNYTFKELNLNDKSVISEQICSGGSDFCCTFDMSIIRNTSVPLNYIYKLLAYYGVSEVSRTRTIGLRNCALVACANDSDTSCGGRHKEAPQGVIFETISIKSSFNPNTTYLQPTTLTHKLEPVSEYTFCKKLSTDVMTEIEMRSTSKQKSLLTFGIYGRVFIKDDTPGGPIINSAHSFITNVHITLLISVLIFLLQN